MSDRRQAMYMESNTVASAAQSSWIGCPGQEGVFCSLTVHTACLVDHNEAKRKRETDCPRKMMLVACPNLLLEPP